MNPLLIRIPLVLILFYSFSLNAQDTILFHDYSRVVVNILSEHSGGVWFRTDTTETSAYLPYRQIHKISYCNGEVRFTRNFLSQITAGVRLAHDRSRFVQVYYGKSGSYSYRILSNNISAVFSYRGGFFGIGLSAGLSRVKRESERVFSSYIPPYSSYRENTEDVHNRVCIGITPRINFLRGNFNPFIDLNISTEFHSRNEYGYYEDTSPFGFSMRTGLQITILKHLMVEPNLGIGVRSDVEGDGVFEPVVSCGVNVLTVLSSRMLH